MDYYALTDKILRANYSKTPFYIDRDVLRQDGAIAAWEAHQKFDPLKNNNLEGYLSFYISKRLISSLRRLDPRTKNDVKAQKDIPFIPTDFQEFTNFVDEKARLNLTLDYEFLGKIIKKLPARQRKVIEDYYFKEETYQSIGEKYGFSKERSRQILGDGLKKLKELWEEETLVARLRRKKKEKSKILFDSKTKASKKEIWTESLTE